jgi:hypothetical protein
VIACLYPARPLVPLLTSIYLSKRQRNAELAKLIAIYQQSLKRAHDFSLSGDAMARRFECQRATVG